MNSDSSLWVSVEGWRRAVSLDSHMYRSRGVDLPILGYLEEAVGWSGGRMGGMRVDGWMIRRMKEWMDA